jgi:hypothetical protein
VQYSGIQVIQNVQKSLALDFFALECPAPSDTLRRKVPDNSFLRGGTSVFPSFRSSLAVVLSASFFVSPAFASRVHRPPTSGHRPGAHKLVRKTRKVHGQQAIEPARVTQIQQALIREHYLTGEANGQWDETTQAAMQKFQADQGWQTKLMPDSRALKKLGLGPDYSTAINAKTASFNAPPPISTIPPEQTAGFTAAAGVQQ